MQNNRVAYYQRNKERLKKKQREYYKENRDKIRIKENERQRKRYWENREYEKERKKKYHRSIKLEVMNHYGNKCQCCGETEIWFLTIDHMDNNGAEHRKALGWKRTGVGFYKWLKENNYPDGYQILCMNCNWGKYANGGICPHQAKRD